VVIGDHDDGVDEGAAAGLDDGYDLIEQCLAVEGFGAEAVRLDLVVEVWLDLAD